MPFKILAKRTLPLVYFLTVSLPHHPFSNWFDKNILIPYGHDAVQYSADILTLLMLVILLAVGFRVVRVHQAQAVRYFGIWLLLLILMYAADRYLIVNNIERIHFPQYAVLSLLLGLSLRNEMLIFTTSSFAGFIDEFLQYIMKPSHTNYLDFNDIVFNMLGAGIGVALLMAARKTSSEDITYYEKRFRNAIVTLLVVSAGLVVSVLAMGRLVQVLDSKNPRSVLSVVNGKLSFVLSFERHDQYWIRTYFGKVFHPFSPIEGLSVIALLSAFTWRWTRWLKQEKTRKK